jgi:acyl-CoA synthetase (AMP-forming)/AMP-acid ligase II
VDVDLILTMAVSFDVALPAVTGPDGSSLTTGELDSYSTNAASVLTQLAGTHVAFCDTNCLAFPVSLFAAVKARLPFVPLNYRLSDLQLGQIVVGQDFVIVASAEQSERLRRLGATKVMRSEEFLDVANSSSAPARQVPPLDPDDVALLLYTSGTTAEPKAAILRHRHLASYVLGTVEFGSAGREEAALLSVPPYHIAGVMNLLSNLYMARRVVYLDSFTAAGWLETVRSQSVTHAMVVPTMLARIVAEIGDGPADTPSLRSLSYGGAKMPTAVIEAALAVFPDVAFANAYGLTETSSTVSVLGPEDHRLAVESGDPAVRARLGSAGLPLPGIEIEIRDDEGRPTQPGTPGDIFVRGEQVAGEYIGIDKGCGWFATRDRGRLDDAGYLFVDGRADDTIIRGGENIAPAEIEEVLLGHEAVADCAVVGIDDEEWGQRIAAAVVLVPDTTADPEEIRSFVRSQLRGSKTPDVVRIVDDLPYTDTGKLLRRLVRATLAEATRPSIG